MSRSKKKPAPYRDTRKRTAIIGAAANIALILAGIFAVTAAFEAHASEPGKVLLTATTRGAVATVFDEPCQMRGQAVQELRRLVISIPGDEPKEGCFGITSGGPVGVFDHGDQVVAVGLGWLRWVRPTSV